MESEWQILKKIHYYRSLRPNMNRQLITTTTRLFVVIPVAVLAKVTMNIKTHRLAANIVFCGKKYFEPRVFK